MSFPTITYISGSETTHGTTVVGTKTTGPISVAANSLLVVAGVMAGAGGAIALHATTPFATTIPGAGAWTTHVEQQANTVNNNLLFIASCPVSTGGSGTVTVNLDSANAGRWAFGCFEAESGYRISTPIVQSKASVTTGGAVPQSISDTFVSTPLAGSLLFAIAGCNFQSGETVLNIAPGAWADGELREVNSGGAISISFSAAYSTSGGDDFDFDNLENNNNLIGAIEIAEARAIAATSPVDYQGRQRNRTTNLADIPIAGTYTGSPDEIEASFNGGAYQTIDASPSGGTFSGVLTDQAMGQGTLTVRFKNDTSQSDTVAYVTIGDAYATLGQSNNGWGQNLQSAAVHATLKAVQYNINATDSSPYTAGTWEECADPGNKEDAVLDHKRGSPWPYVAEQLMDAYDVPIIFVHCWRGGTGLVSSGEWEQGGTYYERAIDRIEASGVGDLTAILMNQGGADVAAGITQAAYTASFAQTHADLKADLAGILDNASTLKVVLVAFEQWDAAAAGAPADAAIHAIREAHRDLWSYGDILPGPTGHTQDFGTSAPQSGVHWYSTAELEILGGYWVRCLKAAFYGGSESARGPQVSAISIASDVVTVTFAGGVAPLQNGTTATGWIVKDDGTPVTIDSAAINGGDSMAIDLTLASAPSGVVTVSWAYGNDASGNPVVDSGTDGEMAPEWFVDQGAGSVPAAPSDLVASLA